MPAVSLPTEMSPSSPFDLTSSEKMMQLQGLRTCLERADDCDFNVFELEKEADGLPLQVRYMDMYKRLKFSGEFEIATYKR